MLLNVYILLVFCFAVAICKSGLLWIVLDTLAMHYFSFECVVTFIPPMMLAVLMTAIIHLALLTSQSYSPTEAAT